MKDILLNANLDTDLMDSYRQICQNKSVDAAKPIEKLIKTVVDNDRIEGELKNIISNIDEFKLASQINLQEFNTLNVSNLDKEEKVRKILNRIIFASNKIDFSLKTGKANYCIIGNKYYSLVKPLLKKHIEGIKVIFEDNLGDNVLIIKLLSNDETKMMNNKITNCNSNKCVYGFHIIDN